MKLSIIIPVYNEKNTIKRIIDDVDRVIVQEGISKEIIIVDDGSNDGTTEILHSLHKKPYIKIFPQKQNQGKTAAVKIGLQYASGDYIIIQDADLEYPPDNYFKLLSLAIEKNAPAVYGSRFLGTIQNMTWVNQMANILSNKTINLLFNSQLTDFHTCHKLIKKEIFNKIPITSRNFSFDTEITSKMLKNHIPILEIPIDYTARDKKEGKKITWRNALETYYVLFKCKFFKS